jgi:concanavalin A-like lectin/glucanase superfamily protein
LQRRLVRNLTLAAASALLWLTGCPLLLEDDFGSGGASAGSGGSAGTGNVPDAGCTGPACGDQCPSDPAKLTPGACGCGIPDTPACAQMRAALLHRYRFDGSGGLALDSVGDAHGTIIGTALSGMGYLELAGGTTDAYVDLPNGMISSLDSATFETWLVWRGGVGFQRIFDFGSSEGGENVRDTGATFLLLTPAVPATVNLSQPLVAMYSTSGTTDVIEVTGKATMPSDVQMHVALVIDTTRNQMLLYENGELESSVTLTQRLSELDDVNNWLGRAQFSPRDNLSARLLEFRIYAAPLDAAAIRASFQAGPDPLFLDD